MSMKSQPPRRTAVCQKCNHAWSARVASPAECPHCKRRDWRTPPKAKATPAPTEEPRELTLAPLEE